MNISSKISKFWLFIIFMSFSASFISCGGDDKDEPIPDVPVETTEAKQTMDKLWTTSLPDLSTRKSLFSSIQKWADAFASSSFSSCLSGQDAVYNSLAKNENIMICYDAAFERVLAGVSKEKPAAGEVYIWMLYNMGYVVKTSSGSFAIDIFHRRAAELAPFIDFYAITHTHNDHKSQGLIDAMLAANKPVLSNFLTNSGYQYTSKEAKDYKIGTFSLHTFITSHNNGTTNVPVTVFQIDCGSDSGNFKLLHSGDSNFRPEEYDVTSDVNIYIPRYAPNELTENNVIGKLFKPDYVLLSHILELSHADPSSSRWTLEQGLTRASLLDCEASYMPFWGEKIVWKNNKIN